jgi:N-acetylmuramoyl-L-alanine amidase/Fibronectin type III domain
VALFVLAVVGAGAPLQQASATTFSLSMAMGSAAQARGVPLPLVQAIAYVNTRWEVISKPARDGSFLPMGIAPSQVGLAATLSGHSVAEVETDAAANLDAGAALLAHQHGAGTDLASWQAAVQSLVGPYVTAQVFEALRTGESLTTSTGEHVTLKAQMSASASVSPSGAAVTAGPAVTSTDYPPASWVPADPANYSVADRPHDYPIDMIVIHDTEGSYGSAIQEFLNPAAQASAHYVVSDLGQITQMVAEKDIAWHAGNWDYNTRAIGIEHEGFASGPNWYTTAMYQASAQLSASICSRWGVPMDRSHVIGHSEVPDPNNLGQFGGAGHHTDPGVNWNWTYYMSLAQGYANALPSPPRLGPDPVATPGDQMVAVSWQSAHACRKPITGYTVVAQPGNIVQSLPPTATRATLTGLQNGVRYTVSVTAANADGQDTLSARSVVPGPLPFNGLYTLDAYGGIHGDSSQALQASTYWQGWRIARAARTLPVSAGAAPATGFVLDGFGGLQSFGGALVEATADKAGHYWNGWDIARDFAFLPDGSGGFVLDGYGGLHPFHVNGSSAPLQAQGFAYWRGWDIARKVVIFADGSGGYVLDGYGGLHPFGINHPAPAGASPINPSWVGWDIARDVVLLPGNGNHSGYLLDGYGGIHPFHPPADTGVMPAAVDNDYWGWDIARGIWLSRDSTAATPKGYVLDGWGGLHAFGPIPTPLFPYWPAWDVAVAVTGQ